MTSPTPDVGNALALDSDQIKNAIVAEANALGFPAVGFTTPSAIPKAEAGLSHFIDNNWHGDMDWMARHQDRRAHPARLWDETKSIIVMGMRYTPPEDPMVRLGRTSRGNISVYALGTDYHDVMKKRLKRIARWLAQTHNCGVKIFVDTAPVMEKPLAQAAGIGWQGKHTNLVSADEGSWLFLGSIFTTLELPESNPHQDQCGSCRACLDVCPTNAFPKPHQLDARRCISYLTIEHKGHIAREFRAAMGNRIYGCDDCLAVCPWNKFARQSAEISFAARAELAAPSLGDLADLTDQSFRQVFSGSPIKRIGRDRFVRNVLIAIGNSNSRSLATHAKSRLDDPSPLVRAMAVWALGRLLEENERAALRDQWAPQEKDLDVLAEWSRDQ